MRRATAWLPRPVVKEVRALLYPWLAVSAAIVIPVAADAAPLLGRFVVVVYGIGAAALGAMSMGHEYSEHTLGALLSLPVSRVRLFFVKQGVLAAMLLALGTVVYAAVIPHVPAQRAVQLMLAVLPGLCGLFVAPWLTMACRSAMAGAVFTTAAPGVIWVVITVALYGWELNAPDLPLALLMGGTLGLCVIGAAAGWRMFMRLEALEGPGADLQLPSWLRRSTDRRAVTQTSAMRHPVWLLLTKELRLQQMTLVVAALYGAGCVALVLLVPLVPDLGPVVTGLTVSYPAVLALLSGAFGSGEERQLGTLEWQALLPMAMSKQWAVKCAVVCGLPMLLGLGLPVALAVAFPAVDARPFIQPGAASLVVLAAAGSLYVSSRSRSGAWAVVMSLPAAMGALWFNGFVLFPLGMASRKGWSRLFNSLELQAVEMGRLDWRLTMTYVDALLTVGLSAMVLWLALANHRSADRSRRRLLRDVALTAAIAVLRVIVVAGMLAVAIRYR